MSPFFRIYILAFQISSIIDWCVAHSHSSVRASTMLYCNNWAISICQFLLRSLGFYLPPIVNCLLSFQIERIIFICCRCCLVEGVVLVKEWGVHSIHKFWWRSLLSSIVHSRALRVSYTCFNLHNICHQYNFLRYTCRQSLFFLFFQYSWLLYIYYISSMMLMQMRWLQIFYVW